MEHREEIQGRATLAPLTGAVETLIEKRLPVVPYGARRGSIISDLSSVMLRKLSFRR